MSRNKKADFVVRKRKLKVSTWTEPLSLILYKYDMPHTSGWQSFRAIGEDVKPSPAVILPHCGDPRVPAAQ